MVLEGVVTTLNTDGTINISPMGPLVEPNFSEFQLRPFQTSTTFLNLKRNPTGVLHILDDVMLVAQAAIKRWQTEPDLVPANQVEGMRLANACQAFEFEAHFLDDASERTTIQCRIVETHSGPRFFGFNRGKHAVLEAAILATRIDFLPITDIQDKFNELKILVQKTGGEQEHLAFDLLESYLNEFVK